MLENYIQAKFLTERLLLGCLLDEILHFFHLVHSHDFDYATFATIDDAKVILILCWLSCYCCNPVRLLRSCKTFLHVMVLFLVVLMQT